MSKAHLVASNLKSYGELSVVVPLFGSKKQLTANIGMDVIWLGQDTDGVLYEVADVAECTERKLEFLGRGVRICGREPIH